MRAYKKLERTFSRVQSLDHSMAILGWDEAVMMPPGGGEARARALAELKVLRHETLTATSLLELLEEAGQETPQLNLWERANLIEIKRAVSSARALTGDLIEATSLASSRCEQAWRRLRSENNWADFLPLLDAVVQLSREEAQQRSQFTGLGPYDSLLDQYNSGLTAAKISSVFDAVKSFLPGLTERIIDKQKTDPGVANTFSIPVENQKALGLEVMSIFGFDFNRGRLDVSHHPFCGGVPEDVRITTRYRETDFFESLMGVIHETGHACYEQGLPRQWLHQPVGAARGMHIHESQSLLFELYLGRNKRLLKFLHPILLRHFKSEANHPFWSLNNLYKTLNKVEPGYIRVSADEVTYPAHVILRFEIESELINGGIATSDIPELWNEKMKTLLGLETQNNFEDGCMQDVHWPSGAFGYFPSYTLGALTAAQFYHTLEKELPQLHSHLESGNLEPILAWLHTHIWSQGCLLNTDELLIKATGETLNPEYFRKHLEQKFL